MDEAYKPQSHQLFRPKRLIRLVPKAPPTTTACSEISPGAREEGSGLRQSRHVKDSAAGMKNTDDKAPSKPPSNLQSPTHSSRSPDHRPSSLTLHSPSRQSLSQQSPRKHHRRKKSSSAAATRTSTPSPEKPSPRRDDRLGSSPERKVSLYAGLTARFKTLSDVDRVKRIRVVAERIVKVRFPRANDY